MIYNGHIHTFMDKDVPEKFLPLGLVRMLSKKEFFRVVSKMLNFLNPWSDNDVFDRYVRVAKISKKGSQQRIFEYCQKFYPEQTRFFILSMDMAFMGCGTVPRPYQEQLAELAKLKKTLSASVTLCTYRPTAQRKF